MKKIIYEQMMKDIAKAYADTIEAELLYVNVDCAKFGVQLKNGAFKNIYFTELKELIDKETENGNEKS